MFTSPREPLKKPRLLGAFVLLIIMLTNTHTAILPPYYCKKKTMEPLITYRLKFTVRNSHNEYRHHSLLFDTWEECELLASQRSDSAWTVIFATVDCYEDGRLVEVITLIPLQK